MNNVGDVLPSSVFSLSWPAGGPVPQEGGGLGPARTTYTEANSLQLVAYSMLHMRHQSYKTLLFQSSYGVYDNVDSFVMRLKVGGAVEIMSATVTN